MVVKIDAKDLPVPEFASRSVRGSLAVSTDTSPKLRRWGSIAMWGAVPTPRTGSACTPSLALW